MKKTSQTSRIFNKIETKINPVFKENDGKYIYDCFAVGKNQYMRSDRLESSSFDMTWIAKIEECLPDLSDIVANPRESTKVVTGIVPVELAKKTNAESVMHLASHTQYIKDVKSDGSIVPSKVLNIGNEQDLHTYENRFIATLIRKLVLFIEKRYEFIQKFAPLHDEEVLYFKSKTTIDGAEVEVETKVRVKSESETKSADISNKYVDRITKIREYVLYFYKSPFMKTLKTEKNVRSPILMTNILRKNVKYHHCYELYRFIERYDALGVAYKVDDNVQDFDDKEMAQMAKVMAVNYLALKSKDKKKYIKQTAKVYKPRVLTSLDDEAFVYGNLLKGPIDLMRVDQAYLDYLADLSKPVVLSPNPNRQEKEYVKEEIEKQKKAKREQAELEKLLRRKKKEQAEFEKKAKAIIAQREREEAAEKARQERLAKEEEERRIEEIRQSIILEAKKQKAEKPKTSKKPKEEKPTEEVIKEEIPTEEAPVVEETPITEAPVEETPTNEPPVEENKLEENNDE